MILIIFISHFSWICKIYFLREVVEEVVVVEEVETPVYKVIWIMSIQKQEITGVSQKRYFRRKGLPNLYLVID